MHLINIQRTKGLRVFNGPEGPQTPREISEALMKSFTDFRDAHNSALDGIDARIDGLQSSVDAANKAIGRMTVGGAGPGIATSNEVLEQFNAALSRIDKTRQVDTSTYNYYSEALSKYLRVGDGISPDIRAELQVGSDPEGGYLAPNERGPFITRLYEMSDVRRLATVYGSTYGSAMELPIDNDQAATGGWVAERETRSETDTPTVGVHTIDLDEQYAMPVATQRMLDDGNFNIEQWLLNKIGDIIAQTENAAFVAGDGVGKPNGFLHRALNATTEDDADRSWGVPQYVPSGASGSFPALSGVPGAYDPDALITLISKLKKPYRRNARWFMNRASEALVSTLKDGQGKYLWRQGSLSEGIPSTLFGYPIELLEELPDPGSDSLSIAFGDMMAAYTIVDRPGIRLLRDPYTTKGKVKFYAYRRVGGDLTNAEALKFLRLSVS